MRSIILFLLIPFFAAAQTSIIRSVPATVTVKSYMYSDVSTNGFIDFKFNSTQELADGIVLSNKFNVNVKSNINWVVNVATLTSNFLAIGVNSSNQMPPNILSIKKSNASAFIPLSQTPNTVALGFKGNNTQVNNSFKLDIKATPGYTFNGGTYAIVLVFTLSPQ